MVHGSNVNSRVQTTHMPIAILTHDWKISSNAKLTTSGYVTFGKSGQTALNWNDDKDPRPIITNTCLPIMRTSVILSMLT